MYLPAYQSIYRSICPFVCLLTNGAQQFLHSIHQHQVWSEDNANLLIVSVITDMSDILTYQISRSFNMVQLQLCLSQQLCL